MSVSVTDLFCGAGGSSIGAELAGGSLRLGLNHWARAIETHATNFPRADHDCADVSALTTAQIRRYPDSDILLASPECTNHSLAKGSRHRKRRSPSMFDDGPAGDDEQERSRATMWDVIRFAEQKILKGRPYKAIVVENVTDAYKWGDDDNGGLFDAWLQAMRSLGYESEIVWLNSMFVPPTPQSRDRMYVVFWRKGMREPNLRVEPPSWCPNCERIVEGCQAFKPPTGRRTGKHYGRQYVYVCPDCNKTAFPGAFPAATAIDWTVPAELIGERARPLAPNTRARIRRGLERLAGEPFAIRLLQSGTPRPLTLPLVTLTRRHDMAMVLPVAGNTFERTPGNRARRADRQPADTVHRSHVQALVVPPMGKVDPKAATEQPAPTQTTTTRAGLVMANTENNVPRPADREAAQTLRTEGGLGMVVANRANNAPRPADEAPSHPVLTGGTLGLVEVQNHGGVRSAGETPAHTVRSGGQHHGVLIAHYDPGWARRSRNEPFGAVTTRDHHSLVIPYDRTSQPRDGGREPARTMRTHDPVALVIPPAASDEVVEIVPLSEADIDSCRFRMFDLHEIAEVMAMARHHTGSEYVVLGNKRERMAQYGNAVTPPVMALLVSRILEVL